MEMVRSEFNGRDYYTLDGEPYTGRIEIKFEDSDDIKVIGYILKGLKSGEWYYFYENGNTEKIENYAYGELNGMYISFYENGKIKEAGQMKYDKLEDMWYTYHKNGNIHTENHYYLGKQDKGIWKEYYETGELKCECPTKMGELYGNYTEYDEFGNIRYVCFMRDGQKNGNEIVYDRFGNELFNRKYVNGKEVK